MIASIHTAAHFAQITGAPGRKVLLMTTLRPLIGRRRQEDLERGIGKDDGTDVATLDDDKAALSNQSL